MILFPYPKKISLGNERVSKPALTIGSQAASPRLQRATSTLGFKQLPHSNIQITIESQSLPENGYRISISTNKIQLTAASEQALYHCLVTLRQILNQSEANTIPCLEIEDWPDLISRGYMLDISRCKVPTMKSLFSLIDLIASLKYNQFQLYTEHTFAYRGHERVWGNSSPLTAEEIKQLDAYCHDRYIDFIPNQNSFGHMERWLRHEPYIDMAECPNGFEHPLSGWKQYGSTLKPTQESLDFVDNLYKELLPNFRSKKLNIGGDEPWELGQGYSKSEVEKQGKHNVYLDHLLALHKRVEAHGHHMQFWGDILLEEPELAKKLPKNLTALLWGYEADHPFSEQCSVMRESGTPFYVVPGTSTWNTIGGRLDNAFANIQAAAANALNHQAEGLLLTDWGDNGHHQSSLLSIPSILYAAGLSWNYAGTNLADLEIAVDLLLPNFEYTTVIQLSNVDRCFEKHLHNGTWLNKVLFSRTKDFDQLAKDLNLNELQNAHDQLLAIQANGELELARQLLLFAAEKGIALLTATAVSTKLPLESFREHWLARNRSGGLEESVQHLIDSNPLS